MYESLPAGPHVPGPWPGEPSAPPLTRTTLGVPAVPPPPPPPLPEPTPPVPTTTPGVPADGPGGPPPPSGPVVVLGGRHVPSVPIMTVPAGGPAMQHLAAEDEVDMFGTSIMKATPGGSGGSGGCVGARRVFFRMKVKVSQALTRSD